MGILHIVLMLLKIVGVLILVLTGLLLLGVLSLLFCPVIYEAEGKKDGKLYGGRVTISWLLHILSFRLQVDSEKGMEYSIRIFGLSLQKMIRLFQRKKKKKKVKQNLPEKPEEPVKQSVKEEPEKPVEQPVKQRVKEESEEPKESVTSRISGFFRKIWLTGKKIYDKINNIKGFVKTPRFARLKAFFLEYGKKTWMHVRPRNVRGHVEFGTEDPCLTGELLAFAGIAYPWYGEHVTIEPYFDQKRLEGTLFMKGRIYGCFFAFLAWKVFRNPDIRFLIKKAKQS